MQTPTSGSPDLATPPIDEMDNSALTSPSRRISVTLPSDELLEIEQTASKRNASVALVIRERLEQWKQMRADLTALPLQAQSPSLPESDPRFDAILNLLRPVERRLQRLDQHCLAIQDVNAALLSEAREHDIKAQSLFKQLMREDIPLPEGVDPVLFLHRMERLEVYFRGVLGLLKQVSLDVAPPDQVELQALDIAEGFDQIEKQLNARRF